MLLALTRAWARLPLGVVRGLGAMAGRAVWLLSSDYCRKTRANLRRAGYPDAAMGARSAEEAGRLIAESPWIWFQPTAALTARVQCDAASRALIDAAEQAGRGILFLTPHLGAFEVAPRWYAQFKPVTVLFKPPRKAALAPVLAAARTSPGLQAVPASLAGVRGLLRALRRGEAVGLVPDQVPTEGDGVWAPFFGEPAWTMTLPQRLIEASGATVLLLINERLPGTQGWRVWIERFDGTPTPQAVNAAMEHLVRRLPSQYLWGYNRYKRPPGVPAPGADADADADAAAGAGKGKGKGEIASRGAADPNEARR